MYTMPLDTCTYILNLIILDTPYSCHEPKILGCHTHFWSHKCIQLELFKIAVQMHHHPWWLVMNFCILICVSPSNDYTAVACSNNQAVSHSCISSLLISRRLSRPRVASRYSVQTSTEGNTVEWSNVWFLPVTATHVWHAAIYLARISYCGYTGMSFTFTLWAT